MRNKSNLPNQKPNYAFVVEGQTEVRYLQMLKRNEDNIIINIKPELLQKKKIEDQYELVKKLANDHKKVYWIIDFDKLLEESQVVKKGNESSLDKLMKYKKIIETKINSNIVVVVNQPCIEFWFLLHFVNTAQNFSNCKQAEDLLKKHITDYSKNQKYLTKQGNDIYLKLKPYLENGIKNSKSIAKNEFDFTDKGYSDMYKIFKEFKL